MNKAIALVANAVVSEYAPLEGELLPREEPPPLIDMEEPIQLEDEGEILFWQKAYVAAIASPIQDDYGPAAIADAAILDFRDRMQDLYESTGPSAEEIGRQCGC